MEQKSQNLKQFVSKFIEQSVKTTLPHLYIVDKQTGPYRSIQQAINEAENNSTIKISQGFYEQNLIINKSIKLEPKTMDENNEKIGVILLINNGIGIQINLNSQKDECIIIGIKISHNGNSQDYLKKQLIQHQYLINNIFQNNTNQLQQPQHQYINKVCFNKLENIIIYIQKGTVFIENCILSLNYLVKSANSIIPAICIDKQGELKMKNSEIKGHESKQTIGILCKLGNLIVQNCKINSNNQGGIHIWGNKNNSSSIIKTIISQNSIGLHIVGQNFKMNVYSNKILNNITGIKVGIATYIDISRNLIKNNINGIQCISSYPNIYLNQIENQINNGIWCKSWKKLLCQAEIKKNLSICGNYQQGILIQGKNNYTKIIQNFIIGFNGQAGIKVINQSNPLILLNKIHKNYQQGILIQENTNAFIEKNDITNNIKCNIAVGGEQSHQTAIINNQIKGSNGVGIIVVKGGRIKINRNDIVNNFNGIQVIMSYCSINRNYIANNINNGIICQQRSQCKIIQNFITNNSSIGLFLKDYSSHCNKLQSNQSNQSHRIQSIIHSNIIINNQINIGLQSYNSKLIQSLTISNTIQGQIHTPTELSCHII